jgi:hypothetical protein
MYTMIQLERGVLEVNLEQREGDVDPARWRRALVPGIWWLHAVGGGTVLVSHRPGDLGC